MRFRRSKSRLQPTELLEGYVRPDRVADNSFQPGQDDLLARATWSVQLSRARGLSEYSLIAQLLGHCKLEPITHLRYEQTLDWMRASKNASLEAPELAAGLLSLLAPDTNPPS